MRVAVVVRSLKIGGMERSAINIAQSFANEGHESHLIYFKSKNAVLKPEKNVYLHHFNLEKIARLSIFGFVWDVFSRLMNSLIRQSYFFWSGIFFSQIFKYKLKSLEKEHGKFDLIIVRGQGTFEYIWTLKDDRIKQVSVSIFISTGSTIRNFFLRCLYDKKHIVCISEGVKTKILEVANIAKFKPKSLNIIYNPMDTELVQKKALEYEPDINEEYLVYFGRITPNKNVSLGISAFNYAKQNLGLNKKFIIIGNGTEYSNIQEQIKNLNIEDSVKMLGSLDNPYPWVKNAELFIFTSKAEGLGNVLLESLACNTPIVSVKTDGGARDIMKNELTDYRVDFNEAVLAKKIVQTLNEKPYINFDKHLEEFTPSFVVQKYINTYSL